MKSRNSFAGVLAVVVLSTLLGACASKAPKEKTAQDAMSAQRSAAMASGDPRACYDEFGQRYSDAPFAYCRNQPQYYVVEERRPSPSGQVTTTATQSEPVRDVTNAEPVQTLTGTEPVRTVVRPAARPQPLPRPNIGVMRMPVPVTGGIGILR